MHLRSKNYAGNKIKTMKTNPDIYMFVTFENYFAKQNREHKEIFYTV